MNGSDPNLSRVNRNKRNRSSRILNVLIGAVVLAIIVVASIILGGDKSTDKETPPEGVIDDNLATLADENEDDETKEQPNSVKEDDEPVDVEVDAEEDGEDEDEDPDQSGVVTYVSADDEKLIEKSIIDTAWKPIGTEQTGEHVSRYDGSSVDWQEKKDAIAYATGLPVDAIIFKKIKNGGSPQKSVGIVTSKDGAEKYRVYLEWVDGEGWKPVKMDRLKSLNFDY